MNIRKTLLIIVLFLIFNKIYCQEEKEILLLPIGKENGFFNDNTMHFIENEADSVLKLIKNDNITIAFSNKFKVFVNVILFEETYQIVLIPKEYSHVLLDKFSDIETDWSTCFILYSMFDLYALDLLPYVNNSEAWRIDRKEKDFDILYNVVKNLE